MSSRRRVMAVLVGAGLMLASAVASAQALVAFPRSDVEVVTADGRHHRFTVEVATTPEQLAQGLMYRRKMAADAGMLFDFRMERPVSMWMRNTLMPLDMLFIAKDGKVVGFKERAVPGSEEIISAPGMIRAVLELNGGTVARLGLAVGDRVVHPIFAAAP